MRRRELLKLISWVTVARPFSARAQQTIYKIGFLGVDRLADYANEIAIFQTGLERTAVIADRKVASSFVGAVEIIRHARRWLCIILGE